MLKKEKEINEKIEDLIDSEDLDDIRKVGLLKEEAQELEDERQESTAKKYFAKLQLEGKKATNFFARRTKNKWKRHSLRNYIL